jgi:tetratricopeptide (TPR) repeat protein
MLKDILENTAIRVGEELSGQPEVEAELRWVIGGTLHDIDDYSQAVEQLEVAAKLAREEWGEESPLLSKVLIDYGAALEANGQVRQAEEPMRQALHLMERQGEKGSEAWAEALSTLGWIYIKSGRSKEALPIARESVKAISEFPESPHLARCFNVLATALRNTGSLEESLPFYREAMEVDLRLKGENHPDVVSALDNYGYALEMARKDDEADSVLKRCLELGRVVHGDRSPAEDHVYMALTGIALRRGDRERALEYARLASVAAERVFEKGHRYWREANRHYETFLMTQIERALGGKSPDVDWAVECLGAHETWRASHEVSVFDEAWMEMLAARWVWLQDGSDSGVVEEMRAALAKLAAAEEPNGGGKKRTSKEERLQLGERFLAEVRGVGMRKSE